MKIGCFDIETDNLYDNVTKFHCAFIINPINNEKVGYRPHQFKEFIKDLESYDVIVGHNICDYDCPVIYKLSKSFVSPEIFDTLVLSRMLEPDRTVGHSLDSWGQSLGLLKGDFGKQENAWEVFTEDMFTYCERDVEVTVLLYKHLCELAGFDYTNPPSSLFDFKR